MGKLTEEAVRAADLLVAQLDHLGDIGSRKMFGGVGIFESGSMFAIVTSDAEIYFKEGESNRRRFETAGSTRFGKMPYFSVPHTVLDDPEQLAEWAKSSIAVNAG